MRLEAQMKGGFYPAPAPAVALACERLVPQGPTAVLDPCAGKGDALDQILKRFEDCACTAQGYAVELEEGRAQVVAGRFGKRACAPADFLHTAIEPCRSFGLIWLNPPFDDEVGGGNRVEYGFLVRATRYLAVGGVLCLVIPEPVLGLEIQAHLTAWYDQVSVLPFPDGHRKYREVIVMGRRREHAAEPTRRSWRGDVLAKDQARRYEVPTTIGPRRFEKAGMTEAEMLRAMAGSPLRALFGDVPQEALMPSPPLELSKGQMALVLAGGFLNTTLQKEGEEAILIKATPYKETYLKEATEEVKDEGTDKERTVQVNIYSERMLLKVRVLTAGGDIHDLQ